MTTADPNATRDIYDEVAAKYDANRSRALFEARWLARFTACLPVDGRVLDLGCGEGTFGPALFADVPENYCGIDLSRRAMKLAARRWPAATWVLANADRVLPVADNSVGQVVSLFGRRPTDEIARVLEKNGVCVVAVPGEEDLIQLREQVQNEGRRRSRWQQVVEQMQAAGLKLVEHRLWFQKVDLEMDEISDALAMTYRAVRKSQHDRMAAMGSTRVTLAADLLLFRLK
jgi:23S rRNA (guanine745-N1)-methyltransferase